MADQDLGIGIDCAQELERTIQTAAAHSELPDVAGPAPTAWTRRNIKSYPRLRTITLPEPQPARKPLAALLARRASCRHFSNEPVQLAAVSSALGNAVACRQGPDLSRPYPSAGARWPVETYLLALNVARVQSGVYHYDATGHVLTVLQDELETQMVADCFPGQEINPLPQAMIVFTIVFPRTWIKYGQRGSRFAYQEAGAAAMALDLAAIAAGLSTIWLGGFDDVLLASLIDVNWELELEAATLTLGLGEMGQPLDDPDFRGRHLTADSSYAPTQLVPAPCHGRTR